jgi:hypothetical protein
MRTTAPRTPPEAWHRREALLSEFELSGCRFLGATLIAQTFGH